MPIPAEILAVERPKGTIVQKSGNKYYVIKRTSKYDIGRRVPVNLGIVGEIRDGKYVERIRRLDGIQVDVKDHANVMNNSKLHSPKEKLPWMIVQSHGLE